MTEKYFKVMMWVFFGVAGLAFFIAMSSDDEPEANARPRYNVTVNQIKQTDADKGLDLRAVGEILGRAKTAEEFEKLINSPTEGVNNLDLNGDEKVDYINVDEFGSGDVRGFSLTTEVAPDDVQEIATITIKKSEEEEGKADVQYHGSRTIYGHNHYYHSTWSPGLGTGLMMGYLWGSHSSYRSPYRYGRVPSDYSYRRRESDSAYSGRWATAAASSKYQSSTQSKFNSTAQSPYAGRNATKVSANLKNPTSSQRAFQTSQRSSRSGGFGRSSSRPSSSSSSKRYGSSSVRSSYSGSRFSGGK